jgi:hypothetical protein
MEEKTQLNNHPALRQELIDMGFAAHRVDHTLQLTAVKEEAVSLLVGEGEEGQAGGGKGGKEEAGGEASEGEFEDEEEEDYKMIFVVRSDLKLSLGKLAELVATAALQAYRQIETQIDLDDLKEIAFF